MFDVVAVNIKTKKIRIMAQNKNEDNAEAFIKIAVMRRGVDEEFFIRVLHGEYKEGDIWSGI